MRRAMIGSLLVGMAACSSTEGSTETVICPAGAKPANLPGSIGGIDAVTGFGENPANLAMYVHAPSSSSGAAKAIVLALHGCTQSAKDYVNAGWNEVADREGLVIVYGEQSSTNNNMRCFRWWDAAHIGKSGEAKSLASMVNYAKSKYGTQRAFVTGLSAGGAMTAVMLAAYPEIFEAGAVMAGLPYKCASSQTDAYSCMSGRTHSAAEWAALIPTVSAANAPRVSIWQGDADWTVRPANRESLVLQWTTVNGVSETPTESTTVDGATHAVHRDAAGVARVESWAIPKMGHGVALDPKDGCGKAGAYALDTGLCSTEHALAFFLGTSPRASNGTSSSSTSSSSSSGGNGGGGVENNPCD